jgi:hypothetical protein
MLLHVSMASFGAGFFGWLATIFDFRSVSVAAK